MADAIFGRLSVYATTHYGSVLRTEESSVLLDIATCVNAAVLVGVLVGVLLERARSRSAVTPRRPLEQPCSESAPTRCSRSEPCAPPAPAPPAPPVHQNPP